MIISLHRNFNKHYKKLSSAQKQRFKERRDIFLKDEFNPILNNHALHGKYAGYRSINITGDLRVVYKVREEIAVFITIDNHSNLYG